MAPDSKNLNIDWYRSPADRKALVVLSRRSDFKGMAQTLGYLGLLALTGTSVCLAAGRVHPVIVLLMLWAHGTCYAFLVNGFHELCHDSVFKTRFLNRLFLRIFSFLGWHDHVSFKASHGRHHKYTLHQPDDQEVVLPDRLKLSEFLLNGFVNLPGFPNKIKRTFRMSCGRLKGGWEHILFPKSAVKDRRRLFRWARIQLFGHASIVVLSLSFGYWMVPIVVTLAPFYGALLQQLCNRTQHIGLTDEVPDFRLCCRTIRLNPFLRFLYWHMNYHTEHHMYASVPCYHLKELHELIRDDLPHCPDGLVETWTEIAAILMKQKEEPTYKYVPELPTEVPI